MAVAPDWIQAVGSVLAILAAAAAIFLQSRELRGQQRELAAQRQELGLQRKQLELQRQELARNVVVQERIATTAGFQHYLDLQVRLLVLMFDHHHLARVFGVSESASNREPWMRHVYMTMWMRLIDSGLALGQMTEESAEAELRQTFFASQLGIDWWRAVEQLWRADAEKLSGGAHVIFVELLERVCQEAERREGSARSRED